MANFVCIFFSTDRRQLTPTRTHDSIANTRRSLFSSSVMEKRPVVCGSYWWWFLVFLLIFFLSFLLVAGVVGFFWCFLLILGQMGIFEVCIFVDRWCGYSRRISTTSWTKIRRGSCRIHRPFLQISTTYTGPSFLRILYTVYN
jgi:hypothetical protein